MPQFQLARQSFLMLAVSQAIFFSSVTKAASDAPVFAEDGAKVIVHGQDIETTGYAQAAMSALTGGQIVASDTSVATSGYRAYGARVHGYGSELNASGELAINTSGEGAIGLAVTYDGKANVERINVVTSGAYAVGVYAGNADVTLDSGTITTTGQGSAGLWSLMGRIQGANLLIKTQGSDSVGILAGGQAYAAASVDVRASTVETTGELAHGVHAKANSSIELRDGTSITTRGKQAHGVYASGAGAVVKVSDGFIETHGEGAAGVVTQDGGWVELNNTHVSTHGAGAVGAQLSAGRLAVTGGSIQSRDAAAINISGQGNTLDIDGAYIGSAEGPALKLEAGAEARVTVSNGSTLSSNNGKGQLLDVQSDSVLDLVVDGSFLHGNLTVPEGGLVNVHLQNGTVFTGQMTDVENLKLDAGVGWNITGNSHVESLVLNDGVVNFIATPSYTRLSMGELSGSGSFGLKLDMNNRQIDFLDVQGQASGNHLLNIQNTGAEPEAGFNPLQVVHTEGGDAVFSVVGERVDMGAYSYGIERQGDDWFVVGDGREVSPATRSVQALFNSAPTVWYGEMSTLRSRMGEVRDSGQGGVWTRGYGNRYQVAGSNGLGYQQHQSGLSVGLDVPLESADGVLLVGLLGGYSTSALSQARGSSGSVDSVYVGTYGTWKSSNGFYLDGVLKLNQFKNRADVLMSDFSKAKGSYRNYGVGASLEAGQQIQLTEHLFIEPFAQVSALAVQGQSFRLDSQLQAETALTHSLLGKVGLTLEHRNQWLSPYIKVAVAQEFARDNEVKVNGHRFNNDLYGTRAELGAGLALSLTNNLQLHADFDYMHGQGIEQPWGANIGARYAFD